MSKFKLLFRLLIFYSIVQSEIFPQSIELHKRDAEAWSREQTIKGKLITFYSSEVTLFHNTISGSYSVDPSDSSFSIPLILNERLSPYYNQSR